MREVSNSDLQTSVPSLDGALVLDAILERKDSNILSVYLRMPTVCSKASQLASLLSGENLDLDSTLHKLAP